MRPADDSSEFLGSGKFNGKINSGLKETSKLLICWKSDRKLIISSVKVTCQEISEREMTDQTASYLVVLMGSWLA